MWFQEHGSKDEIGNWSDSPGAERFNTICTAVCDRCGSSTACRLCRLEQWGGPIYIFWESRLCEPAGWLALLLTKAGDVETNPGPTSLNKRVWIFVICYKQIHVGVIRLCDSLEFVTSEKRGKLAINKTR